MRELDIRIQEEAKLNGHEAAWQLMSEMIQKKYGFTLQELDIQKGEYGKPYSRTYPNIQFNLSHCKNGCACVLGAKPVGIDIERRFPYRESLERKCCHEEEQKALSTLELPEREQQLQVLWSMKESFVKWNGRGLGYGISKINLSAYLNGNYESADDRGYMEKQLDLDLDGRVIRFLIRQTREYTLAVCCEK